MSQYAKCVYGTTDRDVTQRTFRSCRRAQRAASEETPAVSERRLSLSPNGNVRYNVKGFTSVAGAGMRRSDLAEDPLPRWHHTRRLRAARLHLPAGGPGPEAAGQPDAFPRGIRPQQPVPGAGDAGEAGQRRPASLDRRSGRAHSGRAPRLDGRFLFLQNRHTCHPWQ